MKRDTRDQEIIAIMEDLTAIWRQHPGLRLGQLIGNVYHYPSGQDPYHVPDQRFLQSIEKFYESL